MSNYNYSAGIISQKIRENMKKFLALTLFTILVSCNKDKATDYPTR